jgi:hypothetical protein
MVTNTDAKASDNIGGSHSLECIFRLVPDVSSKDNHADHSLVASKPNLDSCQTPCQIAAKSRGAMRL